MRLLEIKGKEIKDQEKIMENLYQLYEKIFSNNVPVSNKGISNYFEDNTFPKLSMEQSELGNKGFYLTEDIEKSF